ncbi:uncharacterized protein METZ01_LOCUS162367 [marine metagenome]|uniref:Uncharacterized protein n=1 Tax=marine metagenome TaxID=408172 RepID=A0A382B8F1_9ZZZZ
MSLGLTDILMPWIAVLMSIMIAIWFKDWATKLAKGIAFKLNPQFKEGDKVILDGERALIVKIGMTETVFGITKTGGEWDGDYIWRYVPNDRIPFLKLEKVVFDHTPHNNRSAIHNNSEEIKKIKNGDKK